jgi:hypothetical protein
MSKITHDYNRQQIATFQQHPDNISATFHRREKERERSFLKTWILKYFLGRPLALSLPSSKGRLTRKYFMVRFAPILEATHET